MAFLALPIMASALRNGLPEEVEGGPSYLQVVLKGLFVWRGGVKWQASFKRRWEKNGGCYFIIVLIGNILNYYCKLL